MKATFETLLGPVNLDGLPEEIYLVLSKLRNGSEKVPAIIEKTSASGQRVGATARRQIAKRHENGGFADFLYEKCKGYPERKFTPLIVAVAAAYVWAKKFGNENDKKEYKALLDHTREYLGLRDPDLQIRKLSPVYPYNHAKYFLSKRSPKLKWSTVQNDTNRLKRIFDALGEKFEWVRNKGFLFPTKRELKYGTGKMRRSD